MQGMTSWRTELCDAKRTVRRCRRRAKARIYIVKIRRFSSIAGGNTAAILLVSIPGERDSRCDRIFLVATNSHNRVYPVPLGSVAGSLSDPNSFPDAIAAETWDVEQLRRACIA